MNPLIRKFYLQGIINKEPMALDWFVIISDRSPYLSDSQVIDAINMINIKVK